MNPQNLLTLQVETPVHGRVLVRPSSGPRTEGLLVGFHGYAENAAVQMERLAGIAGTAGWVLASVQGLNRFYRGRSEETVASWMTREDRDLAIAANLRYVDRAIQEVRGYCAMSAEDPFCAVFRRAGRWHCGQLSRDRTRSRG